MGALPAGRQLPQNLCDGATLLYEKRGGRAKLKIGLVCGKQILNRRTQHTGSPEHGAEMRPVFKFPPRQPGRYLDSLSWVEATYRQLPRQYQP